MTAVVKGSFSTTGPSAFALGAVEGPVSSPLVILTQKGLTGTYQIKVTIPNNAGAGGGPSTIDASNTVKLQKSILNGASFSSWTDVVTYNSAQLATLVTVVGDDNLPTASEQWRVALVSQQAGKSLEYEIALDNFKLTTGNTYV